ncbi:MarR family transcriptional regulator [Glutamicibacter sp.]|uniref:MarR family winged helix-turn-helix transcriptional regulator n=1 Tax=Glutamicibacter sp. TaxID=1931995 RepID=UPI0028BD904D|nr:MarR family transcriptional regulator [Glutamicibacter sp.]
MEHEVLEQPSLSDDTAARVSRTAGSISKYLGRLVGQGRSVSAWRVLGLLADQGPLRIGDLAVGERIAQPTMTSMVQRLEGEGLIEKTSDPADHRAALAQLTKQGLDQVHAYRRRAANALNQAMEHLDDEQRNLLADAVGILERVADQLQENALNANHHASTKKSTTE